MLGLGIGLIGRQNSMNAAVRAMFAAGERGFDLDFGQQSVLYQDNLGIYPVTAAEQTVGLVLDKRFELRRDAEAASTPTQGTLYPFDTFTVNGTGFVGSTTTAKIAGAYMSGSFNTAVGDAYEVAIEVNSASRQHVAQFGSDVTGASTYQSSTLIIAATATPKTVRGILIITAANATARFQVGNGASAIGDINIASISIKKVPGSHYSQSDTTKRPKWSVEGGRYGLRFDGLDDHLIGPVIFSEYNFMQAWGVNYATGALQRTVFNQRTTASATPIFGLLDRTTTEVPRLLNRNDAAAAANVEDAAVATAGQAMVQAARCVAAGNTELFIGGVLKGSAVTPALPTAATRSVIGASGFDLTVPMAGMIFGGIVRQGAPTDAYFRTMQQAVAIRAGATIT